MHPRRDVFPTDWGLRIRMLLIVVLDAILVTAVLALLVYITFWCTTAGRSPRSS